MNLRSHDKKLNNKKLVTFRINHTEVTVETLAIDTSNERYTLNNRSAPATSYFHTAYKNCYI